MLVNKSLIIIKNICIDKGKIDLHEEVVHIRLLFRQEFHVFAWLIVKLTQQARKDISHIYNNIKTT